jgi:sec-independent protein translocase protein TatB
MFEVGFTEIVLILGLALLVLGPEKLPGLAQKVGRWTGRARSMARQLRTQLEHEVTIEELARSRAKQAPPANASTAPPTSDPSTTSTPSEPTQFAEAAPHADLDSSLHSEIERAHTPSHSNVADDPATKAPQ